METVLAKPLSDYFLSLHQSLPSFTQPVVVVSSTVSRSVSGLISASLPCLLPQVSQSESLNSTGTLSDAVQGDSAAGNHSPCLPCSHSAQSGFSVDNTGLTPFSGAIRHKPLLVNTVLSFVVAYRLKGDTDTLRRIVGERFCNNDVEVAKRLLWDHCSCS